jgi:hypothetical protein
MLFTIDLHEDFIDVEGIAVASVLPFQSAGISGIEFYTRQPDRLSGEGDASLRQ